MKRYASVDVLRGVAIISMILIHFNENLSPGLENNAIFDFFRFLAELLAAPFFTTLAGTSFVLSYAKQAEQGHSPNQIRNHVFKRGSFIFGVGLLFAVVVWGPSQILDWDILPLLGVAAFVMYTVRNLSARALFGLAFLAFALAPALRELIGFQYAWNPDLDDYIAPKNVREFFLGFFVNGFFPFFPWITYPLLGMGIGKLLVKKEKSFPVGSTALAGTLFLSIGSAMMLIAKSTELTGITGILVTNWTVGYSKYPTLPSYIFASAGLFLIIFALCHKTLDTKPQPSKVAAPLSILSLFSRYSLTIYFSHHCLHLWPLALIGFLHSGESDAFYGKAVSFFPAIALGILCIALFIPILRRWDRAKGKYSLEWLLKTISS
jgi:uncharacterized membrane protein